MSIRNISEIRDLIRRRKFEAEHRSDDEWKPEMVPSMTFWRDEKQINKTPRWVKWRRSFKVLMIVGLCLQALHLRHPNDSWVGGEPNGTLTEKDVETAVKLMHDYESPRVMAEGAGILGITNYRDEFDMWRQANTRITQLKWERAITSYGPDVGLGFIGIGLTAFGLRAIRRRYPSKKRLATIPVTEEEITAELRTQMNLGTELALVQLKTQAAGHAAEVRDLDDAITAAQDQRDVFAKGTAEYREAQSIVASYRELRAAAQQVREVADKQLADERTLHERRAAIQVSQLRLALISERRRASAEVKVVCARVSTEDPVEIDELQSDIIARIETTGEIAEDMDRLVSIAEAAKR